MSEFQDRLAEALREHTSHVGWSNRTRTWSVECLNATCRFYASGEGSVHDAHLAFNAHVADHLIASEPLRSLLAEVEALRAKVRDMEIERNALRISLEGVLEKLAAVEALVDEGVQLIGANRIREALGGDR